MPMEEQRFAIAEGAVTLFSFGGESGAWQVWLDQKHDFDGVILAHGHNREEALTAATDVLLEGVRALRALAAVAGNGGS